MYPLEYKDIFPKKHDNLLGALIWKASKTYNDIKFCNEAKTAIVVDLNYLRNDFRSLAKTVTNESSK